eukprot:11735010-Karenia_brevis.AAC.1
MTRYLPKKERIAEEDQERMERTGLLFLKEYFETEAWQKTLQAAKLLNWSHDGHRCEADIESALMQLFEEAPHLLKMTQKTFLFTAK